MNILDYSIKLGHSLRKSREGKILIKKSEDLVTKYKDLPSKDLFNQFLQLVDNGKGTDNFFSWFIALEKLRNYLEKTEDRIRFLEQVATFVLQDEDISILANLYKSIGESLQKIQGTILGNTLVNGIPGVTVNNNIKNNLADLQTSIQRSGIVIYAVQVAQTHRSILTNNKLSKYEEDLNKLEYQPYSCESIKYFNEHTDLPLTVRKLMERIRLVQYIVNKGIFEGFEESIVDIPAEYIISNSLIDKDLISNIELSHNYGADIFDRGTWLYRINEKISYYYVIAHSKTHHLPFGDTKELTTDIKGTFYPYSDYRFFEKKSIFYENTVCC